MEFLLVFWIICAVAAALIAGGKGRSSAGFGCLGFILGPIGILIAAIVSPNQYGKDQTAVDNGLLRECPYCKEPIRREAIKCRYCGETVEPIQKRGLFGLDA
jgi:hypothetical protein